MFYENLSRVCAERGSSIWKLLDELNMSRGSGHYWKEGRMPNLDTVIKIANHLGVPVSELLGKEKTA